MEGLDISKVRLLVNELMGRWETLSKVWLLIDELVVRLNISI